MQMNFAEEKNALIYPSAMKKKKRVKFYFQSKWGKHPSKKKHTHKKQQNTKQNNNNPETNLKKNAVLDKIKGKNTLFLKRKDKLFTPPKEWQYWFDGLP